jgi:hypothetical protein
MYLMQEILTLCSRSIELHKAESSLKRARTEKSIARQRIRVAEATQHFEIKAKEIELELTKNGMV